MYFRNVVRQILKLPKLGKGQLGSRQGTHLVFRETGCTRPNLTIIKYPNPLARSADCEVKLYILAASHSWNYPNQINDKTKQLSSSLAKSNPNSHWMHPRNFSLQEFNDLQRHCLVLHWNYWHGIKAPDYIKKCNSGLLSISFSNWTKLSVTNSKILEKERTT